MKFLILLYTVLVTSAFPRNHILDLLPMPPNRADENIISTPNIPTPNIGNYEIKYCVVENTLVWPRAKTTNADILHYLTQRLRMYLPIKFIRVEVGPDCGLRYRFIPKSIQSRIVGLYVPQENIIYVSTTGLTIFESIKVTLHETLHALGLGHNDNSPSIMTTNLTNVGQIIFPSDINGLARVWRLTEDEFPGRPGEEMDYYERLALADALA